MPLLELIPNETDAPETASVLNIDLQFVFTLIHVTSLSCKLRNSVVYLANHSNHKGHFLFGRKQVYEYPTLVAFFTLYLPLMYIPNGTTIFQHIIEIKNKSK